MLKTLLCKFQIMLGWSWTRLIFSCAGKAAQKYRYEDPSLHGIYNSTCSIRPLGDHLQFSMSVAQPKQASGSSARSSSNRKIPVAIAITGAPTVFAALISAG